MKSDIDQTAPMLEEARRIRAEGKPTWADYEAIKRIIRGLNLSAVEYETGIKQVVEILGL